MFSIHLQEYAYSKYQERKKYYGLLWDEIEEELKGCTEEEAVLMRFLYGTMPVRDAGEYDFSVFLSYVQHSLWLRKNMEWCCELDEDIFINHVLYYRINSEDISDCRKFFYEQLKDRIQGMSLKEAVIEINYWCSENVIYESTDSRTASPMTMFRCGRGRCGEESTFTVTAYRSVGIPARQVYTPRWAHCDDNHAWVEVYLHGTWYFLGACEPEEVLNKGWFSVPANRAILIHSRTFSDFMGSMSEECIENEGLLTYYNNTPFYAKTRELTVTVRDRKGNPVAGALVAVEILNMVEYFPAATLVTDELGEARIRIGLGDIKIRALIGDTFAEKKVSPQITGMVELVLENSAEKVDWITDEWEQEEFAAPKESPIHNVLETLEQKNRKARRLKEANLLREQRFAAYYNEELACKYPEEAMMFRIAGENAPEIRDFLTKDENPNRKRMLHSLTVKDYKDLKAGILEDHLDCEQGSLMDEVYEKYLLCPRIYLEELTPYRKFIREYFNEEEKEVFARNPDLIWEYIKDTIHYHSEVDYKTICATPVGALRLREGNPLAQKILFVAICRSLNIPARLNQVLLIPEYLKNGVFTVPIGFLQGEEVNDPQKQNMASLILKVKDGVKWSYYQTWTIGKLEGTHFVTLNYEGISFENNRLELALKSGIYRLITSLRMPSGDQRTLSRVFLLEEGEQKSVEMLLCEMPKEELLVNYKLEDFQLKNETGKEYWISQLLMERPVVLAFLGVGEEPTEHVLNELLDSAAHWNEVGSKMIMVLHDPEELKDITLKRVLLTLPGIELYYDKQGNSEKVAAKMQIDTDKLPVLVLLKKELIGIYACGGYNVGSVELMINLMEQLPGGEPEEKLQQGVHNYSAADEYVWPTDAKVLKKLEWFQDQKLALMMHWGPYSQLGIVESWALSDADAEWSRTGIDWEASAEEFKEQYFGLNKTFNPIRFEPEKWADVAAEAGIRYLVFTTKHHDGFCMWDTKYSDYKITGEDCPYHTNKYADICGHLFEAFRKKGIGIAAYFSKADWHIDNYWAKGYPRGDYMWRGPSYIPAEHPEEWEKFVKFTGNQIKELASRYGKLDIMWFDAGWVCEQAGQDIRLGEVIDEIRTWQPGMLCADRTIGGPYENYITPEQCVPEKPLGVPWESCITLGTSFSFAYEDKYKSPREVINLLVDIVAKGGNLAINVGPQPDGRLPKGAVATLKGMGEWLKVFGEAIYGTRVCAPYKIHNIAFTKKAETIYALEMFEEGADVPDTVWIPYKGKVKNVTMLDTGEKVSFTSSPGGITVKAPSNGDTAATIARVYKLKDK